MGCSLFFLKMIGPFGAPQWLLLRGQSDVPGAQGYRQKKIGVASPGRIRTYTMAL
jgi:hypothetical protein